MTTKLIRITSSDVEGIGKAPDVKFTVSEGKFIVADQDGFRIKIEHLGRVAPREPRRSKVEVWDKRSPHPNTPTRICMVELLHEKDDIAFEACEFASALFWSAWRRQQLDKLGRD